jgi:type I restriction enzyme S subunit
MKSGWERRPLGDLCEYQRGLTYSKGDEVDHSDNVVLRATNIDLATNLLTFDELRYISDTVIVPANKKIKKSSLLVCTASGSKSHLGKVAFIDDDYGYAFGGFMGMITPKPTLLPKYLFHVMTSNVYKDFIGALSDGANINNLKFDDLSKFLVSYPPIPEQMRIAAVLDEAFAGISIAKANAEKNLQNARAIFESNVQSVFSGGGAGWVERPLKDICEKITDGTHQTPTYYETGIIFLSSRNVTSGRINWENIKYIDAKQHAEMHKRVAPRLNDILLAKNGTTGVAAIVDRDVPFDIYVSLALLRAKSEILPPLLLHFINSPVAKKQFNKRLKGIGVPNLHLEEIREVVISFPTSLNEQKIIAERLDEFRDETQRLANVYERKLAALDALKKSLLHHAFVGELTANKTAELIEAVA